MLPVVLYCAIMLFRAAEGEGYDYNRSEKSFAQDTTSSRYTAINGHISTPDATTPHGNEYQQTSPIDQARGFLSVVGSPVSKANGYQHVRPLSPAQINGYLSSDESSTSFDKSSIISSLNQKILNLGIAYQQDLQSKSQQSNAYPTSRESPLPENVYHQKPSSSSIQSNGQPFATEIEYQQSRPLHAGHPDEYPLASVGNEYEQERRPNSNRVTSGQASPADNLYEQRSSASSQQRNGYSSTTEVVYQQRRPLNSKQSNVLSRNSATSGNGNQHLLGQTPQQPLLNKEFSEENSINTDHNRDHFAISGEPEIDYPIFSSIPETSFKCDEQQYPGYYADVEARCQVFHVCANDKMYTFLCPNGTIFHQEYLVCVWWNQFECNSATSLYEINAKLFDYSRTYQTRSNYTTSTFDEPRFSSESSFSSQSPSSYSEKTVPQKYSEQQNTTTSSFGRTHQKSIEYQPPSSNNRATLSNHNESSTVPQNGYPRDQPRVSFSSITSQTSTYPQSSSGTVNEYLDKENPTSLIDPILVTTQSKFSYTKTQSPLPEFILSPFGTLQSYSDRGQISYSSSNKSATGFLNTNDQQRQYLPPVNGF